MPENSCLITGAHLESDKATAGSTVPDQAPAVCRAQPAWAALLRALIRERSAHGALAQPLQRALSLQAL